MSSRKLKNYYSSDSVHGIRNNLAYYKQLRELLDAHKTKAASIEFRKKVLDNQRKIIIKWSMIGLEISYIINLCKLL
jgi:hypothetical protein